MKNNTLLSFLIMLLLTIPCRELSGQEEGQEEEYIPVALPQSPSAAALSKYIEFPVGTYTGIPKIEIPLGDLEYKQMDVPISLSYHATGIKVEQEATSVGLGWTLKAGGAITRTVKGLPDDKYETEYEENLCGYVDNPGTADMGYLYSGKEVYDFDPNSVSDDGAIEKMREFHHRYRDSEPDIFYFNFGNFQGKFVFDENGEIQVIPKQKLKIGYKTDGLNGRIISFTIVTDKGIQYTFSDVECPVTLSGYHKKSLEDCVKQGGATGNDYSFYMEDVKKWKESDFQKIRYASSWHLSEIRDLNNSYENQKITFHYENEWMIATPKIQEEVYDFKDAVSSLCTFIKTNISQTVIFDKKRIKYIETPKERVYFGASEEREDQNFISASDWKPYYFADSNGICGIMKNGSKVLD